MLSYAFLAFLSIAFHAFTTIDLISLAVDVIQFLISLDLLDNHVFTMKTAPSFFSFASLRIFLNKSPNASAAPFILFATAIKAPAVIPNHNSTFSFEEFTTSVAFSPNQL